MKTAFIFQIIFPFLFLIIFFPSLGQHPILTKVNLPEDVNFSGINGMAQDQQGFIWLATLNGLHRYDGYRFISFYHDPNDKNSLASNRTESIFITKSGIIWIGTFANGLDQFDPVKKTFRHFTHNPDDPTSLSNNAVMTVLEDRQGVLWIGTHGGLNRFHPENGTFTRYQHNPNDTTSLSNNQVRVFYEDRQGSFWVGTGDPFDLETDPEEGGMNRFDPINGTFTRYLHDPKNPNTLINNKVSAIYEDSRGNFWVGTLGNGLHTMNREKGTFNRHFYDPLQPDKLSCAPLRGEKKDGVTFVQEDVTGKIWIGTYGSGISHYDPETEKVIHFIANSNNSGGLENKYIWKAFTSKEGVLWVTTLAEDLYYTDPLRVSFNFQSIGAEVFGVVEDITGKIWTATNKGLKIFDQNGKSYRPGKDEPSLPLSLEKEPVYSILEDLQGIIWIGGIKGLWRRHPNTGIFTLFSHEPTVPTSISGGEVNALCESKGGYLWVGTGNGDLNLMDSNTGLFTRIKHKSNKPNSSQSKILVLKEDSQGNLWVGTYVGGGLKRLDQNKKTFKQYLDNSHTVTSIVEDVSGRLWAGSRQNGLFLNDQKSNNFFRFKDKKTGNPFFMGINGIAQDEDNNLWVRSSGSLTKIDEEGNLVSRYGEEMGLNPNALTYPALHKGRNGKLFIGDVNGFYTFYPRKIIKNKIPPQIVLTELRLFDQVVMPGREGLPDKPVEQLNKLELSHDQNVFSFDFAGLHFTDPEQNKHYYMLENYDSDWRAANFEHSASYFKVLPGQYVFRVKVASSEGIWSEKSLPILIHPPWWHTWWAYSLYTLVGICFLYSLRQYTVNRERMKNEMNIQRLEAEKLHEIDHLKSRFFANISHEFRTPLTLILGPLEKFISNTPDESPEKLVFQMMIRNARRLQHLINQLLDLSKIESGNMKLETKPADLISFLKAIVLSFTSLAERKQIQYHFQYPPEHPVAYFDADKLEKIITNLLSNSFKFTSPGGKITVLARLEPISKKSFPGFIKKNAKHLSGAKILELEVQDNGIGMTQDQLDKIFDRFYQADTSHTRNQEGSGIGLSLVKELVDIYSGEIAVKSQPGNGSCFKVRLPLLLADFEKIAISDPALKSGEKDINSIIEEEIEIFLPPDPVVKGIDSDAPIVLIIEDNADVRFFIRENLQLVYQILEAGNGEEGYEMAVKTIPDLVLSDVMMPKMDGVELSRKLKQNEKTAHIPIILLTAKASGGDRIEGLETRADDYLIKPFEANELLVRIKNLIENRKRLRELYSREITLQPTSVAITPVDEQFLQRIMKIIEEHMSDPSFSVEIFSRDAGMSKTQLHRKLKALTNESPGDFIRIMRLKKAVDLLSQGTGTIAEVAYMVGFQEPSYFTKCFQKQYGKTPSEYMAAYH